MTRPTIKWNRAWPSVLVQADTFVANCAAIIELAQSPVHIGVVQAGEIQAVVVSLAEYERLRKLAGFSAHPASEIQKGSRKGKLRS